MNRWLLDYLTAFPRRRDRVPGQPVDLLLCIADHFEPGHGNVSTRTADERVRRWTREYPRLFDRFRDHDGRPPRHTFFYPLEMYRPEEMDALGNFCREGFGEVEVHLHHENDTADHLRDVLLAHKQRSAHRHGLLPRERHTGELGYGFIHGDWALDNSHPAGTGCGVNDELDVLRETGCYADFTLPSYPSPTQTRKINSIYYAVDDPLCPKSHDNGVDVGAAPRPPKSLMLIQGPLILDWGRRKWRVLPRVENGCIQGNQPPTPDRVRLWLRARVQIPSRPDWFFVKLHTHGGSESNQRVLLGPDMVRLHEELAGRAAQDPHFRYHYVTAREMYNLVKAAEDGWAGCVDDARDYQYLWNDKASGRGAAAFDGDAAFSGGCVGQTAD